MTGVVSGVPFSGILCKMRAETVKSGREIQYVFEFVSHSVDRLTLLGVWMGEFKLEFLLSTIVGILSVRHCRTEYIKTRRLKLQIRKQ